jgi:tetratricopeptide (TPR) repeat protein
MRKGIEYFRQAIDLDRDYSLAYAGLADSYNFLGAFGIAILPPNEAMPKARAAATTALEIDESLAEAHTSLAFVHLYYDWDWPAAEKQFQRAIELNPNYALAHQWYSHLLMVTGRTNESIERARRATEIDPLSLAANMNVGWQYHWSRQYDLALGFLKNSVELDPSFEQGHWGLGLAYEGNRAFEQAVAEFQKAATLSSGMPVYTASLGHAYAIGGKRIEAIKIRDELEERAKRTYVAPYWMATLYAGLGEKDRAFEWLEKAYAERSGGLVWLSVDPRLDGIRNDMRFIAMTRRVGLSK